MVIMEITDDDLAEAALRAPSNLWQKSMRGLDGNFVGALGEVMFEKWCRANDIQYEFAGRTDYDYLVDGNRVEVKTKDRTSIPRPFYEVSVPDYNHEHQRPDVFVFMSLMRTGGVFHTAYLLGTMPDWEYRERAVFKKRGEKEPNGMTFKIDCWNVPISDLHPAEESLAEAW